MLIGFVVLLVVVVSIVGLVLYFRVDLNTSILRSFLE